MGRRENECHAMSGNEIGEKVRSSGEDGRCDWKMFVKCLKRTLRRFMLNVVRREEEGQKTRETKGRVTRVMSR